MRKSITDDALISFIDGRPYRTLKRHLATEWLRMAVEAELEVELPITGAEPKGD